ncbi:MAG: phage head closure protein [Pseudomonadota bacterium]
MKIAIGDLRRRFSIERAVDVSDGAGGVSRTWVSDGEVFGRIVPRRRRETTNDGRQVGLVTDVITIRHREGISGNVRFVTDSVVYRVKSVEDADPHRRFLDCWCEEEQA